MNNHSDVWKNITMIIFLLIILMLILFLKINVCIECKLYGTDLKVKIKFLWIEIEKNKRLFHVFDRKNNAEIKVKKFKIIKKNKIVFKILKNILIECLNINVTVGLITPFFTSLATPTIATAIPFIINILNINIKDIKYNVVPFYEDFKFDVSFDVKVSFRIINILLSFV